jgi:hypothetical protein
VSRPWQPGVLPGFAPSQPGTAPPASATSGPAAGGAATNNSPPVTSKGAAVVRRKRRTTWRTAAVRVTRCRVTPVTRRVLQVTAVVTWTQPVTASQTQRGCRGTRHSSSSSVGCWVIGRG